MSHDQGGARVRRDPAQGLPALEMPPRPGQVAVQAAGAVGDHGCRPGVEGDRVAYDQRLALAQRGQVARQAQPSEEAGGQGRAQALRGVRRMQHRPDLRLPGRQQTMERGRDDRDLGGLVGVRERRHRGASDERGLEPVAGGWFSMTSRAGAARGRPGSRRCPAPGAAVPRRATADGRTPARSSRCSRS
jgi:hypothetical protein